MERVKQILDASLLWRGLMALCLWFGEQWRASGVVRWFLNPPRWDEGATRTSLLYRLWSLVWNALHRLYRALKLDKLFSGSVFLHTSFWCALPVILAPLLPTMAVLGLTLVAYCSVALGLIHGKRELTYSPINKYLLLFAGVYMAAAFLSVTPRGSLQPALLAVFFTLMPMAMENAFHTRRSLENLTGCIVLAGTAVGAVGVGQYVFGVTGAAAWVDSDMFSSITTRVYSTLQNPNVLAEYLLLTIPLGVALCTQAAAPVAPSRYWPTPMAPTRVPASTIIPASISSALRVVNVFSIATGTRVKNTMSSAGCRLPRGVTDMKAAAR